MNYVIGILTIFGKSSSIFANILLNLKLETVKSLAFKYSYQEYYQSLLSQFNNIIITQDLLLNSGIDK